jgi:hypothetical protein
MSNARVNNESIAEKAMNSRKVMSALQAKAKGVFEKGRAQVLKDFLSDAVTTEIRGGSRASNSSGTLGGYGNLFSYIGFYQDKDPIAPIEEYLRNFQFSARISKKSIRRGVSKIQFRINWFSMSTIEALSPMPWEAANSWVRGIEKGISGFGHYMYNATAGRGRSGTGTQKKNAVNHVSGFATRRYLPSMLRDVSSKFK